MREPTLKPVPRRVPEPASTTPRRAPPPPSFPPPRRAAAPMPPPPSHRRSPRSTPAPVPQNVIPFVPRNTPAQSLPAIPNDYDATNPIPTIVERMPSFEDDFRKTEPAPAMHFDAAPTIVTRAPSVPANDRAAPATVVAPLEKWAIFRQLGLGPQAKVGPQQALAKLMVSTYRSLGFLILSIIVVVIVGYLITQTFYFMSSSWIEPMMVSPTDEKVIALQAQVTAAQNERDRIAADLDDADRNIATQEAFQADLTKAIRMDLDGRKAELERVRQLADSYAGTRATIRAQNDAYASSSRKRMAAEYQAGLIDRQTMLSGKYEQAQIAGSNLGLQERQVEYENQAAQLEDETNSLEAILDEKAGDSANLSYDVLQIKKELEDSRLETEKAVEQQKTLKASLDRQDQTIAGLEASPQLKALADGAQVAFVPYGNLSHVSAGTALYGCSLGMVWCHEVGKVIQILPGEVQYKHPRKEEMLRGQLVELKLDDVGAAQDDVLFAGGKPLGL